MHKTRHQFTHFNVRKYHSGYEVFVFNVQYEIALSASNKLCAN